MIDTHAHLDFSEFDEDREEVISRFFSQGGKAIINIGVDLERSRKSSEIAERHEGIFASVGLHPDFFSKVEKEFPISPLRQSSNEASNFQFQNKSQISNPKYENLFTELKSIAKNNKVVAIGETGLDYFRIEENREIRENQKRGFLAQIGIAKDLGLPVIVHCRDAWDDLYEIASRYEFRVMRFVLHCYSGEKKDTEKFLKLPNIHFSFSGNITYPKPSEKAEKLAEAIKMTPLDKIMLDSDAPFLAPQEMRGKRNEPINVLYIAKKIAEIKGLGTEIVSRATDEN